MKKSNVGKAMLDQLALHATRSKHAVTRALTEVAYYPAHPPRRESTAYRAIHHELIVEQNAGCLVCGVTQRTLVQHNFNPYNAKAIELHHHVIEWAFAEAIDLKKFNARVVQRLARTHKDPIYQRPFNRATLLAWVDHHPDNLWPLCDVHHRHPMLGIHAITGPIWGPQDLLLRGFGPELSG